MEDSFWWNWWIQIAVAVGTLAVAFVALFGDWLRARLFRPRLHLSLVDPMGEATTVRIIWGTEEGPREQSAGARYYHVRVSNVARWPNATEAQVRLVRLEEPGPDGELQLRWTGDMPINWKFPQLHPLARTIGPDADCDLCSVVEDKWLEVHPVVTPGNLITKYHRPVTIVLTLQSKFSEGVSNLQRFQIAWDGKWAAGEAEMQRHLVVKELT
jgi:hypothetical protein